MAFRAIHLLWLLALLIALECMIIYLSSQEHGPPSPPKRPPIRHHHASKSRSADAPRIAILTLHGHQNSKHYASYWGYDHIDASKSVQTAMASLRRYNGDPSFIRSFALLRFISQYDWLFYHNTNSLFLNFSKPLHDYIDPHYDLILTSSPCVKGGIDPEYNIDTNHFFIKNNKDSMNTLKSIWMMWNHTKCKYPEAEGDINLCQVINGHASYRQGETGALTSVLKNSDPLRVKYTGYRTFNSLYPCHGKGDMIVSFPSLNGTERRKIMHEFLEYTNIEDGSLNITTDSPNHPLLEPTCKEPLKHHCHTKKMCDKQFSSRNKHGHCGH